MVTFSSTGKSGVVTVIVIARRPTERLDVGEVLKKGPLFTFDTGTYADSLQNYFTAKTKDGRNTFRFDVTATSVTFSALMLAE